MILPPYIPIGCSPVWLGDMQLFMVMVPIQQLVVSPGVVVEVPFGPFTSGMVVGGCSWSSFLRQSAWRLILVWSSPMKFSEVNLGLVSSDEVLGG